MTGLAIHCLSGSSHPVPEGAMAHGKPRHAPAIPEALARKVEERGPVLMVGDCGCAVTEGRAGGARPEEEVVILGRTTECGVESDPKEELSTDQRRLASQGSCAPRPFLGSPAPDLARLPVGQRSGHGLEPRLHSAVRHVVGLATKSVQRVRPDQDIGIHEDHAVFVA
jgi:hypothetical protein